MCRYTASYGKTYLGWMMVGSSYWKGMERINVFVLFCFVFLLMFVEGRGFVIVLGVCEMLLIRLFHDKTNDNLHSPVFPERKYL